MLSKIKCVCSKETLLVVFLVLLLTANSGFSKDNNLTFSGNFGLPGIIDLPTAQKFSDGELVFTQQVHRSLARSGVAFQALPRLGLAFRYSGHGVGGSEAYNRINHDRSFDAHLSILDEGIYRPALSIGLKDFIGTGWYSSEYIVSTKSVGPLTMTMGLGYGRLKGKNSFKNPLGLIDYRFKDRQKNSFGKGGTLGTINWFQGEASLFYGATFKISPKIIFAAEYMTDRMAAESSYLAIESPWNLGVSYQVNNYLNLSTQYLHGSQLSFTANLAVNPGRPPIQGGKELAPVPMRKRGDVEYLIKKNNKKIIKKVLAADEFKVHKLLIANNTVRLDVTNTKFRSNAQAIGRVASTLQRFTSNDIKVAEISFNNRGLQAGSYRVDLEKITKDQFNPLPYSKNKSLITTVDLRPVSKKEDYQRFSWGIGPYFSHRLFNPDLPLSVETGLAIDTSYKILPGLKISSGLRKSVLTNLTDNKRRSNSILPRVHSDWPLYDIAGQKGHIHELNFSYVKNIAPGIYGRAQAGILEPFFAGIGIELLYKPAQLPVAIGLDIHRVRKRDYDMLFDMLEYETTVGHFSIYHDVGGMFDFELNAGKYLARDWGATVTIARKFGSGWEVGGYATLTDVPFNQFGEGSFDKAIYISIPIDWITSTPTKAKRRLTLRPITRDGGAQLASARSLYRFIESSQASELKREFGRLWK